MEEDKKSIFGGPSSSKDLAWTKHSPPVKQYYLVQQPTIPKIHNVGDHLVTSNPRLINGGACFLETVHTSEGDSISSGRMEITSGIPPVLHAHSGISPKRELAIQEAYPIIK